MAEFNPVNLPLPNLTPSNKDDGLGFGDMGEEQLKGLRSVLAITKEKTQGLVRILDNKNSKFRKDTDRITNLRERLKRVIPIIPRMDGRAGTILAEDWSQVEPFLPFWEGIPGTPQIIKPPKRVPRGTRDVQPETAWQPSWAWDPVYQEQWEKIFGKSKVPEGVRIPGIIPQPGEVPEPGTIRWPERSVIPGLTGTADLPPVVEKKNEQDIPEDGIGKDVVYPEAGTVTAYNPSWIEQIGNVFNSWFADRKIKNDWMQSPKGQAFQAELARMNATEEDVGIKWGPLLDWALFAGALAIPNDLIVGDLVTLANLLVKGRVSWALLRRFIGKKGVEKLYNYFMQQNIQVPQLNLRSSIKPNPSSVNIASAQGPVDNSILNSRNTAVRKHTTFVIVDSNSIG